MLPPTVRRPVATGPRATRRISATDAARNFSELLNRVQYRGETVLIERGGVAVGELGPAAARSFTLADLAALLREGPKPDDAYWDELECLLRGQPTVAPSPWER